jgi:hypothetical protein
MDEMFRLSGRNISVSSKDVKALVPEIIAMQQLVLPDLPSLTPFTRLLHASYTPLTRLLHASHTASVQVLPDLPSERLKLSKNEQVEYIKIYICI